MGTPYFDRVVVHLPVGKDLIIEARNVEHPYIGTMTLNGKPYDRNYLEHDTLLKGCTISYQMQAEPNRHRGTAAKAAPYSFTNELGK